MEISSQNRVKSISTKDDRTSPSRGGKTNSSNDGFMEKGDERRCFGGRRVPSPYEIGLMFSLNSMTQKLALHVISGAAYGRPFQWEGISEVPEGHQMSFITAQRSVVDNTIPLVMVPRWLLRNLPFKTTRNLYLIYTEFGCYLRDFIEAEKAGQTSTGLNSVLKCLVQNSADDSAATSQKRLLSDDELMGNLFVILFGGHESTYD
jgi:cytochrome P450